MRKGERLMLNGTGDWVIEEVDNCVYLVVIVCVLFRSDRGLRRSSTVSWAGECV